MKMGKQEIFGFVASNYKVSPILYISGHIL